jgi:pimeloyl-ACP methyl ester carboxylesterase
LRGRPAITRLPPPPAAPPVSDRPSGCAAPDPQLALLARPSVVGHVHYGAEIRCRINEAVVHFHEHGRGVPVVALHGAGVDHREIEAALEAIVPSAGYRRIYPDLPGMGHSTTDGLNCNDDVVTLLADFIDHVSDEPVLLLGNPTARMWLVDWPHGDRTWCSAWRCCAPVAEKSRNVPDHVVVREDADAYDELDSAHRAGFDEYFVVRTAATARRYRDHVVPGTTLVDEASLGRIFAGWTLDVGSSAFSAPTLIAAGRRDSVAGCTDATELPELYPHATLAVIEDAGHALMHERPGLLAAFLGDWLDRARLDDK